jgi:hypothetical protein
MVAVAAWGVGFVLMLGVARLTPHGPGERASDLAQLARAQLPGTEAAPTREVSAERGIRYEKSQASNTVHVVRRDAAEPSQPREVAARDAARPADALPFGKSPGSAAEPIAASTPSPIANPSLQPVAAPVLAASAATPPVAATATGKPAVENASAATAPSPAPAKTRTNKRELRRGVLAYLRCEGSERPHARFPCPRDPKLEERVWHVLEALPMCDIDPGAGEIEARITLRGSQISSVDWKAGSADPSLNLRAIGKCAGLKLSGMTTRLKAPESLVSFRFSLE